MKQEMDTTAFTIDTATLTLKKTERKKRRGKSMINLYTHSFFCVECSISQYFSALLFED